MFACYPESGRSIVRLSKKKKKICTIVFEASICFFFFFFFKLNNLSDWRLSANIFNLDESFVTDYRYILFSAYDRNKIVIKTFLEVWLIRNRCLRCRMRKTYPIVDRTYDLIYIYISKKRAIFIALFFFFLFFSLSKEYAKLFAFAFCGQPVLRIGSRVGFRVAHLFVYPWIKIWP